MVHTINQSISQLVSFVCLIILYGIGGSNNLFLMELRFQRGPSAYSDNCMSCDTIDLVFMV